MTVCYCEEELLDSQHFGQSKTHTHGCVMERIYNFISFYGKNISHYDTNMISYSVILMPIHYYEE